MDEPGAAPRRNPVGWDAEITADALDVLQDLDEWRLADERWDRVDTILTAMETAVLAGNHADLRDATSDLELSGPVRANRIGTAIVTGPPQTVRDRRNRLVHALGVGQSPPEATGRPQPPAEATEAQSPPQEQS